MPGMTALFMPQYDQEKDVDLLSSGDDDRRDAQPTIALEDEPLILQFGTDHTTCEGYYTCAGITYQKCGGGRRVIRKRIGTH